MACEWLGDRVIHKTNGMLVWLVIFEFKLRGRESHGLATIRTQISKNTNYIEIIDNFLALHINR